MRTSDFLEEVENLGYSFKHNAKNTISIFFSSYGVSEEGYRRIATIDERKRGSVETHDLYVGSNSENDDELLDLIFEYVKTPLEERRTVDYYAYFLKDYAKNQCFTYVLLDTAVGLDFYHAPKEYIPFLQLPEGCVFEEGNPVVDKVYLSMFEKVAVTRSGEIINE